LYDVPIELVPYGHERLAAAAAALEVLRVREGEDLVCEHELPLIKLVNPAFIRAPYMQPDELERALVQHAIGVLLLALALLPVV